MEEASQQTASLRTRRALARAECQTLTRSGPKQGSQVRVPSHAPDLDYRAFMPSLSLCSYAVVLLQSMPARHSISCLTTDWRAAATKLAAVRPPHYSDGIITALLRRHHN